MKWPGRNLGIFKERAIQCRIIEILNPSFTILFVTPGVEQVDELIPVGSFEFEDLVEHLPEVCHSFESVPVQPIRFFGTHGTLAGYMSEFLRSLLQNPVPYLVSNTIFDTVLFTEHLAIIYISGNMARLNAEDIVARELTQDNARLSSYDMLSPLIFEVGHRRKGRLGKFIPTANFGEVRERTDAEKIRAKWYPNSTWCPSRHFWKFRLAGTDVVLFKTGVIAVDTPHESGGLELVNLVLACGELLGIRCRPLGSSDLGDIDIAENGTYIGFSHPAEILDVDKIQPRLVGESGVRHLILLASKVAADVELSRDCRLWHAATDHFWSGELLQAFILGWTVIERWLQKFWMNKLTSKNVEGSRLKKLSRTDTYTADVIIETLRIIEEFSEETYRTLDEIRRARNRAIHDGVIPPSETAISCIRFANTIIRQRAEQ